MGMVGRMTLAKSSDPATLSKFGTCTETDTSIRQTLFGVTSVSVLERVDCISKVTDQWLQPTNMILNRLFIGSNLLGYVIAI